jgi:hypothetical protein
MRYSGLRDLMPDPDPNEFEEHKRAWYRNDASSIETPTYQRRTTLRLSVRRTSFTPFRQESTAIDPRDGIRKEVHYRGRQDAIIQDLETGRFGILEHKTAAQIDDDYRRKLEKDEQVTSYMWAAEREAAEYGLEYGKIEFTLYNMLRKSYPKPPTELKNGLFSIDRQNESTTIDMLRVVHRGKRDWCCCRCRREAAGLHGLCQRTRVTSNS